jgi:hypothetical protein
VIRQDLKFGILDNSSQEIPYQIDLGNSWNQTVVTTYGFSQSDNPIFSFTTAII